MGAPTVTSRSRRQSNRTGRGVLVLLVVVPVGFVVLGGVGSTLAQSLGLMPLLGPTRLSTAAFTSVSSALPTAVIVSLAIAGASTILAAVIGGIAGVVVAAGGWCARLVAALGSGVVTVPHLVGAATVGLLLADSGVLPRLLGVSAEAWPPLVGGPWWLAVIVEYAWKESAFVALIVAGTMATRVARYDETAALLGAGRAARLRLVFLPLAAPSLLLSSAIVFVYTLGSYEVAWLLGRTYPEPLAVMALRLFSNASLTARPEAAAVAVVTVALSVTVAGLGFVLLRRMAVWR